jgi:hypothetical protein
VPYGINRRPVEFLNEVRPAFLDYEKAKAPMIGASASDRGMFHLS